MQELELLKYPIGKCAPPSTITQEHLEAWLNDLSQLPALLEKATQTITPAQLETAYRPGAWTVRQLVHHLADSHVNAYTRFRLAMTEERPIIRPFYEERWSDLSDSKTADIQLSLSILKAVHARLVVFLKSLSLADFERTYFHPETQKENTIGYLLGLYTWHGKHHLAHIKSVVN